MLRTLQHFGKISHRSKNNALSRQLEKTQFSSHLIIWREDSPDCNHADQGKNPYHSPERFYAKKLWSWMKGTYCSLQSQSLSCGNNISVNGRNTFLATVPNDNIRTRYDLVMNKQEFLATLLNTNIRRESYRTASRYIETKVSALHARRTWAFLPSYSSFPFFLHAYLYTFFEYYPSVTTVPAYYCEMSLHSLEIRKRIPSHDLSTLLKCIAWKFVKESF